MKRMFWILASGLLIVMVDYAATRHSLAACEVPHSTTYRVFR